MNTSIRSIDDVMPTADPFVDEARHHGWSITASRFIDLSGECRTRMRDEVDDCANCAFLVSAFDDAFMSAMIEGKGIWA